MTAESLGMQRELLIEALNELLSAERAGAQVASISLNETEAEVAREMLTQVHRGEADSVRRLRECLLLLDAEPTHERGAFYEKCMAISDLPERLALVDRGQKWVIRKLEGLLEQVTHPRIRQELEAVLSTHEVNSADYAAKAPELK
ncbi:ferritin-like domain-containing protein [Stutzerimonas zhaodongensis]|uniref:Ferritin-like domain-containing protein n=1 Tax=Stutzerimonas zhaodongensis TaxID=1176257 RepID=A0A3M2HXS4_9GAMM|nr:DUF6306 domain-containing protein [Stutzerimonas zhaodongensis]MCQ4314715.1 DUF6306 domain-containing protein [Stutzerimonas zhaodongensis]RMH92219.1 ferritin-like domain-containing protein [Stutzerimonas zhaodongensis]